MSAEESRYRPEGGGISVAGFLRSLLWTAPAAAIATLIQYFDLRLGGSVASDALWIAIGLVWIVLTARGLFSPRTENLEPEIPIARQVPLDRIALISSLIVFLLLTTWRAWTLFEALAH
jgi:hypothetical protein